MKAREGEGKKKCVRLAAVKFLRFLCVAKNEEGAQLALVLHMIQTGRTEDGSKSQNRRSSSLVEVINVNLAVRLG